MPGGRGVCGLWTSAALDDGRWQGCCWCAVSCHCPACCADAYALCTLWRRRFVAQATALGSTEYVRAARVPLGPWTTAAESACCGNSVIWPVCHWIATHVHAIPAPAPARPGSLGCHPPRPIETSRWSGPHSNMNGSTPQLPGSCQYLLAMCPWTWL